MIAFLLTAASLVQAPASPPAVPPLPLVALQSGGVAPPPGPPRPMLRITRKPDARKYYPSRERKAKKEGTVEVGLTLRQDGRVSGCRVRASSGSPALDAAACKLGRAIRFEPSTGAGPKPSSEFGCCLDFEVRWTAGTATLRPLVYAHPPTVGNRAELLTAADYPAAALRAEEQGRVTIALSVSAGGQVTGCTVTQSSGSPALDATTCRLAQLRAQVKPGRNRYGEPEGGTTTLSLVWRLQD